MPPQPSNHRNEEAASQREQQQQQQEYRRQQILNQVSINGMELSFLSKKLRADPEIVNIAVAQYGGALRFASPKLKANPEIVKIAVAQNGGALRYASRELQANPEIVKIAVSQYGDALQFASPELQANPEIVKIAVAQYGRALQFASPELQANPEIVKIAVAQYGRALQYAWGDLHNDPALVALAIRGGYGYNGEGFQGHRIGGCLCRLQKDLWFRDSNAVLNNVVSIRQLAMSWRNEAWQRIYPMYRAMQNKFAPVGVIVEYSEDISGGFGAAKKLEQLAPVILAFAGRGVHWKDLPQWLVQGRDDSKAMMMSRISDDEWDSAGSNYEWDSAGSNDEWGVERPSSSDH